MRKLLSFAVTLLLIGMVLCAGIFLIPGFFGYELFSVEDQEMAPRIQQGSLVLGKAQQAQDLETDDVVIYHRDSRIALGKVLSKDDASQTLLIGKGTDQPLEQENLPYQEVWGRGAFTIPYLGMVYNLLHTERGMMIAGFLLAGLVILTVLLDFGARQGNRGDRYGRRDGRDRYRDYYYR